jgi:hypothetical protein
MSKASGVVVAVVVDYGGEEVVDCDEVAGHYGHRPSSCLLQRAKQLLSPQGLRRPREAR